MAWPPSPKPMHGKLIVHVGDHKAGSSTIQAALARGDVSLRDARLCYPLTKGRWNQNYLSDSLRKPKPAARITGAPSQSFRELGRLVREENGDVTILSGEELEWCNPERLRGHIARSLAPDSDALTVIAYLRPHVARALSSLAEQIKIGWAPDNPTHLLTRQFDRFTGPLRYGPRLDRWRKAFGDAYVVRPVIRSELANGSLLEDFLTTTLGSESFDIRPGPDTNASLSVQDLMRLHIVHMSLTRLNKWGHHALGWGLAEVMSTQVPEDRRGDRIEGNREFAEKMRATFLDDARHVDRAFLGDRKLLETELDRAVDMAPAEVQSLHPEDWLTASEIRDARILAGTIGFIDDGQTPWRRSLTKARIASMLGG